MNLTQALAKCKELRAKLDTFFVLDSSGAVDYDATPAFTTARKAEYKSVLAEYRDAESVVKRCEEHQALHNDAEGYLARTAIGQQATRTVDELRDGPPIIVDLGPGGTVASVARASGLTADRRDPLVNGMRGVAEEVLALARGETYGAMTTTDAEGGFTVPIIVAPELEVHFSESAPMVALSTFQNRDTGNQFNIPTVDASGVTASRVAENVSPGAAADLVFAQSAMGFDRFDTPIFTLTNELIQDSAVDIIAEFAAIAFNAVQRALSDAATDGTGGSSMDGFTENANVTSALTTATNTAILWGELAGLFGSLSTRSQRNAVFMFNNSVEGYLFQQVDGDSKPVIIRDPNGGVTGTGGGVVRANEINIPYAINPKLPDIAGGSKSVYCGDFSRYRMFGAPNANGTPAVEIIVFRDSAYTAKNTVGLMARARRAGKYLSIASGDDCRFITQKA